MNRTAPRPWHTEEYEHGGAPLYRINASDHQIIADDVTSQANAELIVKAVNSHDNLVNMVNVLLYHLLEDENLHPRTLEDTAEMIRLDMEDLGLLNLEQYDDYDDD